MTAHRDHASQFACFKGGFWFDEMHLLHETPDHYEIVLEAPVLSADGSIGLSLNIFEGEPNGFSDIVGRHDPTVYHCRGIDLGTLEPDGSIEYPSRGCEPDRPVKLRPSKRVRP